jgi:membrane associated rhomboid family serine protease
MIPLRDNIPSQKFPIANWILILANVAVFILEMSQGDTRAFIFEYGLVPADTSLIGNKSHTFFTNMFLHGGAGHLLTNMWMLYIFGDNVEDRMGSFRYLTFYILTGLIAGLTHYMLNLDSGVPAVGASGAISGVMAAYMFLFPNSQIISFVPLFFIPMLIPVPAMIFIGIWFLGQFLSGTSSLLFGETGAGIAFWAHIGGFLGGLAVYRAFTKSRRQVYRMPFK